jgi:dihydrofolate synthase/folylpolyglutamate synthase
LGLPGAHQVENAGTALAALWTVGTVGFKVPEGAIRQGLAGVRWPGRFERIAGDGGPEVVLDGAHTPASARALAETFAAEFPGRRAVLVLGLLNDKDGAALIRGLAPITAVVVATQSRHPRAMAATAVAAGARAAGLPFVVEPEVWAAVTRAKELAGEVGLVLVTGSLFVVAEAREALGLAVPDPVVE